MMYYYIDETGHSGNNVFVKDQPYLYYGLLISPESLDESAGKYISAASIQKNTKFIHTKKLSTKTITRLLPNLLKMKEDFNLSFKLYRINKLDHVVIMFFDKVFDYGLNPGFTYNGYWTYLRYIFVLELFDLFDERDIEKAWRAHVSLDNEASDILLKDVCQSIKSKTIRVKNNRIKTLIRRALTSVINNPRSIRYNSSDKNSLNQWSPNIINFQSVLHGVQESTVTSGIQPKKIIVDQQFEFNNSQQWLHDFYKSLKKGGATINTGYLPEGDYTNMPDISLDFLSSKNCIGLQVVDMYLWIHRRYLETKSDADDPSLYSLVDKVQPVTYELSKSSITYLLHGYISRITPCKKEDIPIVLEGIDKLKLLGITMY